LGYPGGNFSEVFDSIGSFITKSGSIVETETSVRSINIEDGKAIGLEVQSQDTTSRNEHFDCILSTTPSSIFSKLVPNLPAAYQKKLTSIKYLAAVLVILVLEKPLTEIYWMNIADPGMPFVALIEHTNLISSKIYGGRHILYISNYVSRDNPMYSMSKEELLDQYVPHLSRINPNFNKDWIVDSFYHRENSAQPIIGPNYGKAIPTHRTPVRSLYLANTTQIYPEDRGTNYSVRIGRKVAQMIMADNGLPIESTLPAPAITNAMTLREE
jgi:protoporphyrinogen oxidase